MRLHILTIGILLSLFAASRANAITFTTLDEPGATNTSLTGISDGRITGNGFVYDGSTFTKIFYDDPVLGPVNISVTGIDGSKIVGYYINEVSYIGLIYDGTTFTQIPGDTVTVPGGIDHGVVVGFTNHLNFPATAFQYDGTTFSTFTYPGATSSGAGGIGGSKIVGNYVAGTNEHGFIFDGTNFATLDYPGAAETFLTGVDGNDIVGYYDTSIQANQTYHGFLYDGTNFTPLDYPGASSTTLNDIDGSTFVGSYTLSGTTHGLIVTVPEPTSAVLGLCALACFAAIQVVGRTKVRDLQGR